MSSGRLPKSANEFQTVQTVALSQPERVREMVVTQNSGENDLVIKVFLNEGVVENLTGEEQFIFITATHTSGGPYQLAWGCGASGIDQELLPEDCRA